MKRNDLALNELCLFVRQNAGRLPELQREQMERTLFLTLAEIEKAARQAQERLNEMKFHEASPRR